MTWRQRERAGARWVRPAIGAGNALARPAISLGARRRDLVVACPAGLEGRLVVGLGFGFGD